jgi:glycine C-acetyltransferase
VPKGKARIHTQISAAHTKEDLDKAIEAFVKTYKELHSKLRPKK